MSGGSTIVNTASIQSYDTSDISLDYVLLKRLGRPVECAPLYVLLASNESSFVIGETYGVTGGNPLP